jgi:hypothetical protein
MGLLPVTRTMTAPMAKEKRMAMRGKTSGPRAPASVRPKTELLSPAVFSLTRSFPLPYARP